MKKEKNGWKDLNLQTADSDDTRNQAKMKFPILKIGLISIFLKIENGEQRMMPKKNMMMEVEKLLKKHQCW